MNEVLGIRPGIAMACLIGSVSVCVLARISVGDCIILPTAPISRLWKEQKDVYTKSGRNGEKACSRSPEDGPLQNSR